MSVGIGTEKSVVKSATANKPPLSGGAARADFKKPVAPPQAAGANAKAAIARNRSGSVVAGSAAAPVNARPPVPMFDGGAAARPRTESDPTSSPKKSKPPVTTGVDTKTATAKELTPREKWLAQLEDYRLRGSYYERAKQTYMDLDIYGRVHDDRKAASDSTKKVYLNRLIAGKKSLHVIDSRALDNAAEMAAAEAKNAIELTLKVKTSLPKDIDQYRIYNSENLERELFTMLGISSTKMLLDEAKQQFDSLTTELKVGQSKLSALQATSKHVQTDLKVIDEGLSKIQKSNIELSLQVEQKAQLLAQLKSQEELLRFMKEPTASTSVDQKISDSITTPTLVSGAAASVDAKVSDAAASSQKPYELFLLKLNQHIKNVDIHVRIKSTAMHCEIYGLTHKDRVDDVEAARVLYLQTLKALRTASASKVIDFAMLDKAKLNAMERAEKAKRGVWPFVSKTCLPQDIEQYHCYIISELDETFERDLDVVSPNALLQTTYRELQSLASEVADVQKQLQEATALGVKKATAEQELQQQTELAGKLQQQLVEYNMEIEKLNKALAELRTLPDKPKAVSDTSSRNSTGRDSVLSTSTVNSGMLRATQNPQNNILINRDRFKTIVSSNCFKFVDALIPLIQRQVPNNQDILPYAKRFLNALLINAGLDEPLDEKTVFDNAFAEELDKKNTSALALVARAALDKLSKLSKQAITELVQLPVTTDLDIQPYAKRFLNALLINAGLDEPLDEKTVFDNAFAEERDGKNTLLSAVFARVALDKLWKCLPELPKNPLADGKADQSDVARPEDYPAPLAMDITKGTEKLSVMVRGISLGGNAKRSVYQMISDMLLFGWYFPKDKAFAVEFIASNSFAVWTLLRPVLIHIAKNLSVDDVESVFTKLVELLDKGVLDKNDFLERLARADVELQTAPRKNPILRAIFEKVIAGRKDELQKEFENAIEVILREGKNRDKYNYTPGAAIPAADSKSGATAAAVARPPQHNGTPAALLVASNPVLNGAGGDHKSDHKHSNGTGSAAILSPSSPLTQAAQVKADTAAAPAPVATAAPAPAFSG